MAKFVVKKDRLTKAKKIEQVLCDYNQTSTIKNVKILDIGCGNGEIIQYFQKNNNEVFAVDALNQLSNSINLKNFKLVTSAILPYESNTFNIIISNHVIEHIEEQDTHMKEIYRCLKSGGVCYFTTPNWNFFIEPHHKIPFIHYFGNNTFYKILRLLKVYEEDIYLLSYRQMKNFFKKYNFLDEEFTAEILKKPKKYYLSINFTRHLPKWLLHKLSFLAPNNIFILLKK